MRSISSNGFSHDQQAVDALSYLHTEYPEAHREVREKFPERIKWDEGRTWLDTEAMGVDPEWPSWLCDAIENTGKVMWEDGEPYDVGQTE